MSQFKILSLFAAVLFLISCSSNQKVETASTDNKKAPVLRTVQSDLNTKMMGDSTLPAADTGGSDIGGDEGGGGTSEGRKIVIPKDQEGLKQKCDANFANRPSFLKGDENPQMAFDPLHYTIKHRAYEVSYNFYHLNPNWVYHRINRSNLQNSCAKRDKGFYADNILFRLGVSKELVVNDKSFKGSGFDRGHMAPSADFQWNQDINKESFFMTNMSPQTPGLNQQTWEKLESRIRRWACGNGELEVYTGPILEQNLNRLDSCVSIPNRYFKVLAYYKNGKHHGIAFVYPQTDSKADGDPFEKRAVSIRKLEEMTGIDFFADKYSKEVQESFETSYDMADWAGTEDNCMACNGKLKQPN